ncbi:MAG TPA: hypothetical protein VK543_19245, partial [Puia sp.]|nr:hypothetical protein [Puia sp.]
PANTNFTSSFQKDLLNGIVSIQADLPVIAAGADSLSVVTRMQKVTAIPYFVWCNRAADPMQVWIPQKIKDIKINY